MAETDYAQMVREAEAAAAQRQRYGVYPPGSVSRMPGRRDPRTGEQETSRFVEAARDALIPQTPADVALMALGTPLARIPIKAGAKAITAGLGAAGLTLSPEEAQAKFQGVMRKLTPGMLKPAKPQEFYDAVKAAKEAHPQGFAVDLKDVKEYGAEGVKLLATPDKTAGLAVMPDGTLSSVFKHPAAPYSGAGPALAKRAVQAGADRLDAFDTVLPAMYQQAGFREVGRVPFNPEMMPDWQTEPFKAFSGKTPRFAEKAKDVIVGGPGEPDLVGMVTNPPGRVASLGTPSFENLQELQRLALEGRHPAQFLPQARRVLNPGIYDDPAKLAREAAAMVPAEDPSLKRLFNVTREDLYATARAREAQGLGDLPPPPGLPKNPRGSAAASAVMNPANEQRLVDVLSEGTKYPQLMHGMYPWHVEDPAFQQMARLIGHDAALVEYPKWNTFQGLASSRSKVLDEIRRGTAAYSLNKQGLFPEFASEAPTALDVPGHFFHKTHAKAMQGYLDTGKLPQGAVKTPAYIQSSDVPETGYSWKYPPGDLHFVGGLGLPDVRAAKTLPVQTANIDPAELAAIAPWWANITRQVGMNPSSGHAVNWALYAGPTGVKTDIGVPKLELQSRSIMRRAHETGKSPERVRDEGLQGLERWAVPFAAVPAAGSWLSRQPEPTDY